MVYNINGRVDTNFISLHGVAKKNEMFVSKWTNLLALVKWQTIDFCTEGESEIHTPIKLISKT